MRCFMTVVARLTPWAISAEKRFACPATRLVKRRKQFLLALEHLQDELGDLNDIAVHEERISAMAVRGRRSNPSRAFAADLLAGRESARIEPAMTAGMKAHAALAKVKPFWR